MRAIKCVCVCARAFIHTHTHTDTDTDTDTHTDIVAVKTGCGTYTESAQSITSVGRDETISIALELAIVAHDASQRLGMTGC